MTSEFLWAPMLSPLRWPLAGLAMTSAAAHLPVLSEHLHEVPYIGVEFIVLIVACILIAIAAPAWAPLVSFSILIGLLVLRPGRA